MFPTNKHGWSKEAVKRDVVAIPKHEFVSVFNVQSYMQLDEVWKEKRSEFIPEKMPKRSGPSAGEESYPERCDIGHLCE